MVKLNNLELIQVKMPLVRPFQTSFGIQTHKEGILLKIKTSDDDTGWGEIPLTSNPGYCYETISTAWHILSDFIIPEIKLNNNEDKSIDKWITDLKILFESIRGHNFAKSV